MASGILDKLKIPEGNKEDSLGFTKKGFNDNQLNKPEEKFNLTDFVQRGRLSKYYKKEKTEDYSNILKNSLYKDFNKKLTDKELYNLKESEVSRLMLNGEVPKGYSEEEWKSATTRMVEKYKFEKTKVDCMNIIYNSSLKEVGLFKRYIALPAYQALTDIIDITDTGDMASLARIGSVGVGMALGGELIAPKLLAKGVGKVASVAGGIAIAEGIGATADTGADYLRAKSEGIEMSNKDIAKDYGINFAANVAFVGVGLGVGKIYRGAKKSVVKGMGKVKTLPIEPITAPVADVKIKGDSVDGFVKGVSDDIAISPKGTDPLIKPAKEVPTKPVADIPGEEVRKVEEFVAPEKFIPEGLNARKVEKETLGGAVEDIINNTTGSKDGTFKATQAGLNDGKIDWSYVVEADDTISIQAQVLAHGINKSDEWGRAANTYLQNDIGYDKLVGKSRREIMTLLSTDYARLIIERNKNLAKATALERASSAMVNNARTVGSFLRERFADPKDWNINKVIASSSKETKRIVANFSKMFRNEGDKVFKQLSEQLSRDSGGTIRAIDTFYARFSKDNNIISSLYTGKLTSPENFTEAEIKTFENFRELYFDKVLKMDILKRYGFSDPIVERLRLHGNDTFDKILVPAGNKVINGELVPTYSLNPELDQSFLTKKISFAGINSTLSDQGIDTETIAKIRELIFGDKLNTKKSITEGIRKLKAEGKLPKRIKGLQKQIDELFKDHKTTEAEADLEKIIKSLVSADNGQARRQLNKIWAVFNKANMLKIENLVTEKNKIFQNVDLTKEQAFKKIDESKGLTVEQKEAKKELIENIVQDLESKTGKKHLQVELDFFGLEIPTKKGAKLKSTGEYDLKDITKLDDIRKIDVNKLFKKINGVELKKLPDSIQDRELRSMCFRVVKDQNIKIGKRIEEKIGTLDLERIKSHYLKEFGIDEELTQLRFMKLDDGTAGSFGPTMVNGKKILSINMSDQPFENAYYQAGVLRHELEHLREYVDVGSKMNDFDNKIFVNNPGLKGKEVLERIKAGKKVSVREMVGEFYTNHFYDWRNDTFETSLSAIEMAEKYNDLDSYTKLQLFLRSLSNTTALTKQQKIISSDLLTTNNLSKLMNSDGIIKSDDAVEEFIARRFESPDSMIDFISNATKYNNANRFNEVFQRLHGTMTNENIGFSREELVNTLRKNASSVSNEKFSTKENEETKKVLNFYADALSTHIKGMNATVSSSYTNTKLVTGLVTNGIIGFRHFKDVYSAIASTSLQFIVHGEYSKGMKVLYETAPDAARMFGASLTQVTSNLIESTQKVMGAVMSNIKGYNVEVTAMDSFVAKLRKIGSNTQFVIDNNQRRIVAETLTSLNLMSENIDKNSLKGVMAQHTMKGMLSLQSDDIFSQIMATKYSQSELYDMMRKGSYEELNKIQKFMYGSSGYVKEEFNIFKEKIAPIISNAEKVGLENTDDYLLRAVLNSGETQLDLMGRAKTLNKGTYNPFMYLTQTIWHLATETISDIASYSDYGVYMGTKGPKEIMETLFVTAGSTLGVASGAYLVKNVANSLKDQQSPIRTFNDDVKEIRGMSAGQLATTMSRSIGNVTPLALGIKSSELNAPYQVWLDIAKTQYKKGDMGLYAMRFYYGSMVGSIANNLVRMGDDNDTAHGKAMSYMTTPQGKKQLIDYATDNIKNDSYKFYRMSKEKYYVDNREALKNGIINQDDYLDNINSVK